MPKQSGKPRSVEQVFEDVIEAPAKALDSAVEGLAEASGALPTGDLVKKAGAYWHTLGPGLTTGASDDDPSGIATYSQTGAQFGYQLLWLAPITLPLMATVQEMCARIGLVTGKGLASNIRQLFPRWALYLCTLFLFAANTFNIGADLGAMAKATQLIAPQLNFGLLVAFFTVVCLGLQIFSTYEKYARILKYLAMVLLCYVVTAFIIPEMDWRGILQSTIVPSISLNRDMLLMICAILGTTISPYLFFWQTSQEVEEKILDGNTSIASRQVTTTHGDMKNMRIDVWSGMFFSNLVMYFIIAVCASTLFKSGITNIGTAADAAAALEPLAGSGAKLLFAVGILGTGMLAVPVLAGSSAYAIAESFGWREGLYRKLRSAYAFYGILIVSMIVGLLINFVGLDPIKALIWSAVANGVVAPVVLVFIVLISSNKKVMGEWVNHRYTTVLGWVIVSIMALAGIAALVSLIPS